MGSPDFPSATLWPEFQVPSPLPTSEYELGTGRLITLDLLIGEHVPGHLIMLRTLELGGYGLISIESAAFRSFLRESPVPIRTLADRQKLEEERSNFIQDYIAQVPLDKRDEFVVWPNGEDSIHFDLFPGIDPEEDLHDFLYVTATDDLSTSYNENHTGGWSPTGGLSSSGEEDLGGHVPSTATRLWLDFAPSHLPDTPWVERIEIDLIAGEVSNLWWH